MQNIIIKITFWTQALLLAFLIGRFSYNDSDGFGIFVPSLGGYHISLVDESDTGVYQ